MFTPEALLGRVVAFDDPYILKRRLVGTIKRATPLPPTKRGNIPDMQIEVEGRTGKVVVVSYVESHADTFDTWAEALASVK